MCIANIVIVLGVKNFLSAERVDKGGPAGTRGAADHQAELDSLLDILLPASLEHLWHC